MYALIIYIPLMSAVASGLFGRKLGERGAGLFTTSSIILASALSWFIFYEVGLKGGAPAYIKLWTWIESGPLNVSMGLMFDSVTASMLILVTTVSALVHMYSTGYMAGDPHLPRFMSYLSLFTFFMVVLVTGDNLLQLFIGWEGVGLCSYLLINFWYTRIQANKSAMKAMIVNRVGDVGLALAMFVTYSVFKSLDYATIFAVVPALHSTDAILALGTTSGPFSLIFTNEDVLALIGILLLVGAVGKSAQLGLHTWLPDAMEGPTPVSALIHAATMVTAGVFLLIRCAPLLEYAPKALSVIVIIGAMTALFAASVGLVQNDIKKVIAYSTCSQLGYMVFACGLSQYSTSLFHLVNHGFFKALLFLSAGSVIHAMADEQDMRKLGGLIKAIPFTYTMMLIGSLSLMGFPFLTGYYSKDAILELAYATYTVDGTFAHWLGTLSAFFTAFYSFRLIYLTFITDSRGPALHTTGNKMASGPHESPWVMSLPLVILAFGSIFVGYLFKDAFIGLGTPFFTHSPSVSDGAHVMGSAADAAIAAEFLSPAIALAPVGFSLLGAGLAALAYGVTRGSYVNVSSKEGASVAPTSALVSIKQTVYVFLNNKWHWDTVYTNYIAKPLLAFGYDVYYKVLDRGLIEHAGPVAVAKGLVNMSQKMSSWQAGSVCNYAFAIFVFATLALLLPVWGPADPEGGILGHALFAGSLSDFASASGPIGGTIAVAIGPLLLLTL